MTIDVFLYDKSTDKFKAVYEIASAHIPRVGESLVMADVNEPETEVTVVSVRWRIFADNECMVVELYCA